ncbi:immunity 22 family protein [Ralstonia solanacearum]|uniref:immunity 22 family protein n=1 Tax=Ralstonia solanacearum TaxID=305 RepID=UPI001E28BFF8
MDWFDDDFREAAFFEGSDLREEIAEFSYGSSFAEDAARDLGADRKEGENGVIVLYDFDYSARERGASSGRVRFVGSYDYEP